MKTDHGFSSWGHFFIQNCIKNSKIQYGSLFEKQYAWRMFVSVDCMICQTSFWVLIRETQFGLTSKRGGFFYKYTGF